MGNGGWGSRCLLAQREAYDELTDVSSHFIISFIIHRFPMPIAVVTIETHGFPASLAAADAMVKAGRVTLIKIAPADSGHQYVVVRGPNAEAKAALEAGLKAANACYGDGAYAHTLIPNPTQNVLTTLELDYTEESLPFVE